MTKLLKGQEAIAICNGGRSQFYAEVKEGLLPAIVKFGSSAYVPHDEMEVVMRPRIAGRAVFLLNVAERWV
jgi:hypothetical protein